jgi:outer membrane biosynthesis protein TonB
MFVFFLVTGKTTTSQTHNYNTDDILQAVLEASRRMKQPEKSPVTVPKRPNEDPVTVPKRPNEDPVTVPKRPNENPVTVPKRPNENKSIVSSKINTVDTFRNNEDSSDEEGY